MHFADIHCHILPYLDDGAQNLDEALQLLQMQSDQGTSVICFTPHLRHGMFHSTQQEVEESYRDLIAAAKQRHLHFTLCHGREYYCDNDFLQLVADRNVKPLGRGRTLLVEFSDRFTLDSILHRTQTVLDAGYQVLIAHCERYAAMDYDPDNARRLLDLGVQIQVNAGSLLGREGFRQKQFAWKLLKQDIASVVASDAHGCTYRPPELKLCADQIEKKLGLQVTQNLLYYNPLKILNIEQR